MKHERVPVIIRLRLPDKREFDCHSDVDAEYADSQLFWWTDGNGACDCNRSLYLNREHKLKLGPLDEMNEHCLPCGDTIELVKLTVNGIQDYPGDES